MRIIEHFIHQGLQAFSSYEVDHCIFELGFQTSSSRENQIYSHFAAIDLIFMSEIVFSIQLSNQASKTHIKFLFLPLKVRSFHG